METGFIFSRRRPGIAATDRVGASRKDMKKPASASYSTGRLHIDA
jgi:hypothetical protein